MYAVVFTVNIEWHDSAKIWATIYQPTTSTNRCVIHALDSLPCWQQIPLVMMRLVASVAQCMNNHSVLTLLFFLIHMYTMLHVDAMFAVIF